MAKDAPRESSTSADKPLKSAHYRKIILFLVSLLIFLALISYHAEDAGILSGGVGESGAIHNWIGYFGAAVSRMLVLYFGFGAYLLSFCLVLACSRRLFGRRGLRRISWDYLTAFLLVAVGSAMLLGIWPSLWSELAAGHNIARIPGGVIGQRLCAPSVGWLQVILHPTGSAIVAAALVVIGLIVIWMHDWHDLAVARYRAARAETEEPAAAPTPQTARARAIDQLRASQSPPAAAAAKEPPAAEKPRQSDGESAKKSKKNGRKEQSREAAAPPPKRPAASVPARTGGKKGAYRLPGTDLLDPAPAQSTTVPAKEVKLKKEVLQATLDSFGIDAKVGQATSGPRVTLLEVLPAPGVKVERISQISNNIAMELRAVSLRILTPIPGKNSVGIEVPNTDPALVNLSSLMSTPAWKKSKAEIPLLLGRNISGKLVVLDLARAPHLLIAGATGSGKSVCINALIMSLLYRFSPEEMQLIMVDPKVVEFSCYTSLPHLVVPVITDCKKVPLALRWVIKEMERRYQILAKVGARNLSSFNSRRPEKEPVLDDEGNPIPAKLPFIVVVVDELADIMMTAKSDVETSLARIAQLSRAVGIHTIIATQRPSVNVITGTIKANFPTRIAFQVTSQVDSRTILDGKGAESLLGRGDMLFRPPGAAALDRIQGSMVADEEIDRAVEYVASQAEQEFDMSVFKAASSGDGDAGDGGPAGEADEELVEQAIDVILRDRRATTSYVQRCLRIGYNRAALVMETLEDRGIIGPQVGTSPREILIDRKAADGDEDASCAVEDNESDET